MGEVRGELSPGRALLPWHPTGGAPLLALNSVRTCASGDLLLCQSLLPLLATFACWTAWTNGPTLLVTC